MLNELAALISTLTTTVVSFSAIYFKITQHRKKDKAGMERIEQQLKEHIDKDNVKGRMPVSLRATAVKIMDDKLITDDDLRKIIIQAVTLISSTAERVIMADFSSESLELLRADLENDASMMRKSVNPASFAFVSQNQYTDFVQKVKIQALHPAINLYIANIEEIKSLKNGKRLDEFETITKKFVETLIRKIINILNNSK